MPTLNYKLLETEWYTGLYEIMQCLIKVVLKMFIGSFK